MGIVDYYLRAITPQIKKECSTLTGSLEKMPNGEVLIHINLTTNTGGWSEDITGIIEFHNEALPKNLPSYFTIKNAIRFTQNHKKEEV